MSPVENAIYCTIMEVAHSCYGINTYSKGMATIEATEAAAWYKILRWARPIYKNSRQMMPKYIVWSKNSRLSSHTCKWCFSKKGIQNKAPWSSARSLMRRCMGMVLTISGHGSKFFQSIRDCVNCLSKKFNPSYALAQLLDSQFGLTWVKHNH